MKTENQDIEQLLLEGNSIRFKPKGYSMYPIFVPGRDEAVVEPVQDAGKLRRGDVVLYRRLHENGEKSILVLHRIWKVGKNGIYLVGDNQREIEGPLMPEQMKGILVMLIRKGKSISAQNIVYRFLTGVWLWLRPVRPYIAWVASKIKKLVGK